MTQQEAIALVSQLLGKSNNDVENGLIFVGRDDLYYFSLPITDNNGIAISGESIIVSKTGELLYANSSVSQQRHLEAFDKGIRTPVEAFRVDYGTVVARACCMQPTSIGAEELGVQG